MERENKVCWKLLDMIKMGNVEKVKTLLNNGVKECKGALSLAIEYGQEEIVDLLLEHGFKPDSETENVEAVLSSAFYEYKVDESYPDKTCELVEKAKRKTNTSWASILSGHAKTELLAAVKHHMHATLLMLLDEGVPFEGPSVPWPAIIHAASSGNFFAAKTLVARGANANVKDPMNQNVLFYAYDCHPDLVQFFIDQGADVNCIDASGASPLFEFNRRVQEEKENEKSYRIDWAERTREILLLSGAKAVKPKALKIYEAFVKKCDQEKENKPNDNKNND